MIAIARLTIQIRRYLRTIVGVLALAAVLIELGGIWNELHQLRREQVKNALYALPGERRTAIRQTSFGRRLESTVNVQGAVEVDGDVKLSEPVEVEEIGR